MRRPARRVVRIRLPRDRARPSSVSSSTRPVRGETDHRDAFLRRSTSAGATPTSSTPRRWDFARFSRGEAVDTQIYKATLRKLGLRLSAYEVIPDGDFGPLIEFVIDLKNRLFLKDLSRNVKRACAEYRSRLCPRRPAATWLYTPTRRR